MTDFATDSVTDSVTDFVTDFGTGVSDMGVLLNGGEGHGSRADPSQKSKSCVVGPCARPLSRSVCSDAIVGSPSVFLSVSVGSSTR